MKIYGVDFTSAPRRRKPIAIAVGKANENGLRIEKIGELWDFASFEEMLGRPGPWVGGFDFPFGLSREAITDLAWPLEWSRLTAHCKSLGRAEFKRLLDDYRKSRPKGSRYASRRGDKASGAHPSVKLVNPPVGFMFLEGASRLAAAGLHVPGLHAAGDSRIALEAYPGLLVRKQLGIARSYKSDIARQQNSDRSAVRAQILASLQAGQPLGAHLQLADGLKNRVLEDGSGDRLDAIICAVQAHWGWMRKSANYGLPANLDPLEGWIVTA